MNLSSSRRGFSISGLLGRLHWGVILLILLISISGFMMLYSAAGGQMKPWASAQVTRFIPGFILMLTIALIPIKLVMRFSYLFYIACVGMLIAVEVMGHIGMGAQRWMAIGSVNLQPSEITKLAVVLALARYFNASNIDSLKVPLFLIPPILIIAIPAALILKQPNLGTATILSATGLIIFFAAGVPWRYFIGLGVTAAISMPIIWQFLHAYQKQRVLTFLNPEADPLGAGYNVIQSIIAIGSGGLIGKGYLEGSQAQLDFLPEKQTDFIFTMLAEELGFTGCCFILLCYTLLMAMGYRIALASSNQFGALVAIGVTTMLFLHLLINVGMTMGLLPVVGVPLPLFSYGGSILIAMLIGFGLMLNVWTYRNEPLGAYRMGR